MKRALFVLLFIGALFSSLDLASAVLCPRCGPYQWTNWAFGMGNSCAEAQQNAYNSALSEITCDYGTCYEQVQ